MGLVPHRELVACHRGWSSDCYAQFHAKSRGVVARDGFRVQIEILGKHGCDARNLFLFVHFLVISVAFKIEGDFLVDSRQESEQVHGFAVFIETIAEGLNEPRASDRIPPGEITRNHGIRHQNVRLHRKSLGDICLRV